MSMRNRQDDVANRVNDPRRNNRLYAPYVLRSMNRVYRRINLELECLEKVMLIDFTSTANLEGTIDGYQAGVNTINLVSGHTITNGSTVYNEGWLDGRTVTAVTTTSITISGLPVTVRNNGTVKTLSNRWPLPEDIIKINRIRKCGSNNDGDNMLYYRPPERFNEVTDVYTVHAGHIVLGGFSADTQLEIWYTSSGFELVDAQTTALTAGQANAPEWPWHGTHDLLFYATCLEVRAKYEMREQDEYNYRELYERLRELTLQRQDETPEIMGGIGPYDHYIDDYERPTGWRGRVY